MRKSKSARPSSSCAFDSVIVFLLCMVVVARNAFVASCLCVPISLTILQPKGGFLKEPLLAKLKEPLQEEPCQEEKLHPISGCPLLLSVLHRHHSISNCVSNYDEPFSMVASQEERGSHRREHSRMLLASRARSRVPPMTNSLPKDIWRGGTDQEPMSQEIFPHCHV